MKITKHYILTILSEYANIERKKHQEITYLRSTYTLFWHMAYGCQQSRIRWWYRYDSGTAVCTVPSCAERCRSYAAIALLYRCHFTRILLEAVASQKCVATDTGCCHRYRTRKLHLERHFRRTLKKGHRWNRLFFRGIRIRKV